MLRQPPDQDSLVNLILILLSYKHLHGFRRVSHIHTSPLLGHRDNEDALILLGWEWIETLKSKDTTQKAYSGEEPAKFAHLEAHPMNELHNLGPNTAHLKSPKTRSTLATGW